MNKNGNEYRNDARRVAKETSWTFWRFLPIITIVLVVMAAIIFGVRSVTKVGSTIVERKVFENSFQYQKGMEQRAAIIESNIVEIDALLRGNPPNKGALINQRAVLKSHLRAITINK